MESPAEETGDESGIKRRYWSEDNLPRIRSITGIRIHQLTLPESLALSHRRDLHLHPDDLDTADEAVPATASNAGPSGSRPDSHSSSHAFSRELDIPRRQRSGSTSTFVPSSPPANLVRPRTTRPRAPTLAGEAMEHAHEAAEAVSKVVNVDGVDGSLEGEGEDSSSRRILARCFVVLKLSPERSTKGRDKGTEGVYTPSTSASGKGVPFPIHRSASGDSAPGLSRSTSSASVKRDNQRPGLQTSPSSRSLRVNSSSKGSSGRERTTSMQSTMSLGSNVGDTLTEVSDPATTTTNGHERATTSPASTSITGPRLGSRQPRLVRAPSDAAHGRRPTLSRPNSMYARRGTNSGPSSPVIDTSFAQIQLQSTSKPSSTMPATDRGSMPFYISPIYRPSTHPRFLDLIPRDDFAAWLSPVDSADSTLVVEVWYEDPDGEWQKVPDLGGCVDMKDLRRVEKGEGVPDNTLEFTLVNDPRAVYYLPTRDGRAEGAEPIIEQGTRNEESIQDKRLEFRGVMEKSMRETRMKRGAGLGAVHQLVNTQAVLAGTQSSINNIIININKLLSADKDRRALKRELAERQAKVVWLKQSVLMAEKRVEKVGKQIGQDRDQIARRRALLHRAERNTGLSVEVAIERQAIVQGILDESASLKDRIHQLRAHHVQSLDALFPIVPIDPSSLLYSILDVPLPIPTGAHDRTPPIMLPARKMPDGRVVKVDEQTTAASLGYVALVLQVLVGLQGSAGKGLGYPVTYAGSRSLVKDVTSVMTGPRSFPLYTKGVERYRFEYAVFLLNKNIDIDANIRLVDARHTLPNLKALLLTLSSPDLPPPPTVPTTRKSSGASTYVNTRATSRQTSYHFSLGMTRAGSIASSVTGRSSMLHSPRPSAIKSSLGTGPRQSFTSRPDLERGGAIDITDDVLVSTMPDQGVDQSDSHA